MAGTLKAVLLTTCLVWSLFWSAFLLHGMSLSYRFGDLYWMKGRTSKRRTVILTCMGVTYTLTRPLTLYTLYIAEDRHALGLNGTHFLLYNVSTVFAVGTLAGMALQFSLRVYAQYFEAQLAVTLGIAEWRSLIDESIHNDDTSWFVRHKNTWGNQRFLDHVGLALWTILVLISVSATLSGFIAEVLVYLLVVVPLGLVLLWVSWKYPPFKDTIFLRKEKYQVSLLVLFALSGWLLSVMFPWMVGWDYKHNHLAMALNDWLRHVFLAAVVPLGFFIISIMVIANFEEPNLSINCGCIQIPLNFELKQSLPTRPSLTKIQHSNSISMRRSTIGNGKQIRLAHVLADNNAFRAFMSHLFAEFSYENVLCLIEFVKFKERMCQLNSEIKSKEELSECDEIQMNNSTLTIIDSRNWCDDIRLARSSIVCDLLNSMDDARMVAYHLFDQYISEDARYRVNLSYHLRASVRNQMSDISQPVSESLFDPVIQECYRWLRQSLERFEKSAEFSPVQ